MRSARRMSALMLGLTTPHIGGKSRNWKQRGGQVTCQNSLTGWNTSPIRSAGMGI